MGYWKSKVVPMIKRVFEKNTAKKAAAAEACKGFDDSKEEINKAFEEKKEELQPKVLEIYEAASAEIKAVVKERTVAGVKKHAAAVNTFLEELVKIEFPGSKAASEASANFGPALVPGPVFFVFEKVATFLPVEEPKTAEPAAPEEAPAAPAGKGSGKEKEEAVVEEEKTAEAEGEDKAPAAPEAPAATERTTASEAPAAAAEAAAPEPAKAVEGEEPPKA